MRKLLLAGAVLALSACSGGNNDANNASAGADNMGMDLNTTADQNSTLESVNAAAANGSIDANTQAAMQNDVKTHDQDTNLANGM
jgi:hypothetical protein